MKFDELRTMNEQSLQEKLTELRKELMKTNAQVAVGTVPKNPGQIKQTRKTIARILHIIAIKQRETMLKGATSAAKKSEKNVIKGGNKTQGGTGTTHG